VTGEEATCAKSNFTAMIFNRPLTAGDTANPTSERAFIVKNPV
jgi:hypothetical protein